MNPEKIDVLNLPWRVGRKVGRTIYAVFNPAFPDDDELIGMMDTETAALEAVEAHNEYRGLG